MNNKQIQKNLQFYKSYYIGYIDGINGNMQKNAVKLFQKEFGLTVDGICGILTTSKLLNVIKMIQKLLNKHGFNLTVDGLVGNNTLNAYKYFIIINNYNKKASTVFITQRIIDILKNTSHYSLKYFKESDFACTCCGVNKATDEIKILADKIRDHFGKPMIITSGYRCQKHNDSLIGSVKNSYHVKGKAIDFYIQGVSSIDTLNYTKSLVKKGVAMYTYGGTKNMGNAVHVQVR